MADGKVPEPVSGEKKSRLDRVIVLAGDSKWKFVREERAPFTCVCGGHGEHAIILSNEKGEELAVGKTCLKYFGVALPVAPKVQKGVVPKSVPSVANVAAAISK